MNQAFIVLDYKLRDHYALLAEVTANRRQLLEELGLAGKDSNHGKSIVDETRDLIVRDSAAMGKILNDLVVLP